MYIWTGISLKGPTKIIIFEGTMDGPLYVEILKTGLLPFLAEKFPAGHRFMQVRCFVNTFINLLVRTTITVRKWLYYKQILVQMWTTN